MTTALDWQKDYYHKDPWYGLNDWEAVVAFVRGLLENTEDKTFCWPNVRQRVLAGNSLLSQTFVQHLGRIRDARGVPIIIEKLGRIGPGDRIHLSPWCRTPGYLEQLCLEALASIGGTEARETIERYRRDPRKRYLARQLAPLEVAPQPRPCVAPLPPDWPEVLRGVRSYHDVQGEGGCDDRFARDRAARIIQALRDLPWRGAVELLSGDGVTSTFELTTKITDHIHDCADPFSDFGIFLSNPKVEYPLGRRRWANSHTFLYFPVVDGSLYGAEYTWDVPHNTLTTHFHEHVALEPVRADPDGWRVTVVRKPISTGVELRGNVFSRRCNSAVRGVWDNPDKRGKNYYARRAHVLLPYKQLYYFRPLHEPIVNQLGIWVVDECEKPERFFDAAGLCTEPEGVIEQLLIPLHEPKVLAWDFSEYRPHDKNDRFAVRLPEHMRTDLVRVPDPSILDPVLGVRFAHDRCGQAGVQQNTDNGYKNGWDLNSDGVIDQQDQDILARHAGQVYRMNVGDFGYFGFDWLSWGNRPRSKGLTDRVLLICAYDYGAGYEPDTGKVYLSEPAAPGQKLYVEYFHDAPALEGKDNIKVYLHPGL